MSSLPALAEVYFEGSTTPLFLDKECFLKECSERYQKWVADKTPTPSPNDRKQSEKDIPEWARPDPFDRKILEEFRKIPRFLVVANLNDRKFVCDLFPFTDGSVSYSLHTLGYNSCSSESSAGSVFNLVAHFTYYQRG